VPDDAAAITHEVLTVRHAAKLTEPSWNQLVASRVRQLREEGRLDDLSTGGQAEVEEVIRDEIQRSWRAMGPRQVREFVFEDLLVDKEKDDYLHLHFKPLHTGGLPDTLFYARYEFGDPREPNTLIPGGTQEFVVDRFHSLPIPVRAVNSEGTLYVRLGNVSPTDTIMFEGDDSIELLVNIGTFHWNLFRALAILWCRLAFLAALGLLASTFVSFPVACMIGFLVLLVASSAGFLGEAMDWGEAGRVEKDPFLRASGMLRPLAMTFIWMVPNFSKFDAMGNVVSGRLVPLMWVMQSLAVLVVIKGAILGILGCTILTKRELAQATT
jgi:hypothetical protein